MLTFKETHPNDIYLIKNNPQIFTFLPKITISVFYVCLHVTGFDLMGQSHPVDKS